MEKGREIEIEISLAVWRRLQKYAKKSGMQVDTTAERIIQNFLDNQREYADKNGSEGDAP